MNHDINFEVIGNSTSFSMMGESSGYMITVNDHTYLLECGSPIFPRLGYRGIADIRGIFVSHSHEDHKRWFTDIVLYTFYNPLSKHKVRLISSEPVLEEFAKNSKGALERSLSVDSKRVVDIPYQGMVEEILIGPRAKYFINLHSDWRGAYRYTVEDRAGNVIKPDKAKIVINPAANRPRLLFKDEGTGEWVEPESYYPFSSIEFYEENRNTFHDEQAGLTVEAVKSSVWHGVPAVAFKFLTEKNSLFFSADTVYKPSLWQELCEAYRPQKFESISRSKFEKSSIIYGDINDFIERTWSRERFESAMKAYESSIVIHDVARKDSIVHTDYVDIGHVPNDKLIFTHNPDNLTTRHPILSPGKKLALRDGKLWESVKGTLYYFDADVYIHHFSCNLVGYRSKNGKYKIIEKDGLLGVICSAEPQEALMRVDLYEDVNGEYFPILLEPEKYYSQRYDGQVEEVTVFNDSSSGKVVENLRGKIAEGTGHKA